MKRIISLILVVVMSVLTLASCGYSIADENISDYATLTDKDGLLELIKSGLQIVDGDFTDDESVRAGKVLDDLYNTLSTNAKKGEKLEIGIPGSHDVIYYCYYVTAEIETEVGGEKTTKTHYFYVSDKMKSSSPSNVQIGMSDAEGVAKGIATLVAEFDFENNVYEAVTTGTTETGNVAFVTYTYSYTAADGSIEKGNVTNEMIVVTDEFEETVEGEQTKKTPLTFAAYLNGKSIGSSLDKTEFEEAGKGKVSYSGIKINWVGKGDEIGTFTDVTFDVETKASDIMGNSYDLKDKELTYHVYPVYYNSVPELTAKVIIDEILGKNITEATLISVLFGEDYEGLHVDHDGHDHDEDDFTEEEKKNMEQLEKWLKEDYLFKDGDKELTLSELCELIAELQSDVADVKSDVDSLKTDLDKAQDKVDDAQKKVDEAQKAVDAAGPSATESQKKALETAKTSLTSAKTALDKADKAYKDADKEYTDAKDERDAKVNILLDKEVEGEDGATKLETKIYDGYVDYRYRTLRDEYNTEVKKALATEVFYFVQKYVTVKSLPEKAVDLAYDQLIQNYQSDFYASDSKDYSKHNGDFKAYLVATVGTENKTTYKNYDEALAAVKVKAEEYVTAIVKIYCVADALNLTVTDEEYKDYKNEKRDYVEYYGENDLRYAQQFDKLMNYFLESEEEDGKVTYKYITSFAKDEKSGSALDKEEAEEK